MNWKPILIALAGMLLGSGSVLADQPYVHKFTGFTFPLNVEAFARVRITPFNDAHSDIEVDYDDVPFTVHLSAYVYPAYQPLPQHYEQCKGDVVKVHPDAKLLEEKPVTFDKSGVTYHGFKALYSFRDKFVGHTPQDLLSQLIVFRRDDYYVLFRISYALKSKDTAEAKITDFLEQFAWPAGGTDASAIK
jgi:hypothetical protein